MIQITCKGNSASCTRTERLTSGMVGLQCEFIFDEAWDGLAKTAVFLAGNEQRDVLLTGAICTVPWEVLQHPGYQLVIGVFGSNADGTLIIPTVYAMCGSIAPGADPSGEESTDPTLPVWGQLQGMIGNLAELATTSKDNLVDAINEAAQSGGGSGGTPVTEQTVSGWGFTKNTGTYSKPSGGIPKTDLADDVQASLSKANSALQEHQDVSGKQDTLIKSGAAVGQIAKITAVDSNGKPTAWQAVDIPSGGGKAWKCLRSFTLPEDPSSDTSGITWNMCRCDGYTDRIASFEFSTDENGGNFSVREVFVVMNMAYGIDQNYFGLSDQNGGIGYGNLFTNRTILGNKSSLTRMALYVRSIGTHVQGILTTGDNYTGPMAGQGPNKNQLREDEDITKLKFGTFDDDSILPGSSFEFWGR